MKDCRYDSNEEFGLDPLYNDIMYVFEEIQKYQNRININPRHLLISDMMKISENASGNNCWSSMENSTHQRIGKIIANNYEKIREEYERKTGKKTEITFRGSDGNNNGIYEEITHKADDIKIVAVVPMKLNNTRLPQKNTRSFKNGKPLCCYILSTLLKCRSIDEVYVYCSNEQICNYLPKGVRYLKRSEKLDQDTTKMNEILIAFAEEINADIYVMTHATAPFVEPESFEKGIEAIKSGQYDSAFAVKKMQDFIWKNNKPFNYDLNQIPRTQDLETLYVETSGFYVYKNEIITKSGRRIGENPCLIEVGEVESCDIDEYEDFMIADAIQFYKQMGEKDE